MSETIPNLSSLDLIAKYTSALCERDNAAMQTLRAPNFVLDWVHNDAFANKPLNQEEASQFWPTWFAAFPEMDYEVTRTIAAESVVVAQWIFTGTQVSPLVLPLSDTPLKPTEKTIRVRGVSVYDIETGLIQKETMYIDLATLYVELGVTL